MSYNLCQRLGKLEYLAKICSRAKIDFRGPPWFWQGLLDISLIKVHDIKETNIFSRAIQGDP